MPSFFLLLLVVVSLANPVWAQETDRQIYKCPDPPDHHYLPKKELPPKHKCKPFGGSGDLFKCPGPVANYPSYTENMWEAVGLGCWPLPSQAEPSQAEPTKWSEYAAPTRYQSTEPRSYSDIASDSFQRGLGLVLIFSLVFAVVFAVRFAWRLFRTRAGAINSAAYEAAAAELDSDAKNAGLWAKHYAANSGDESKTRAAYIKERARLIHQESLS